MARVPRVVPNPVEAETIRRFIRIEKNLTTLGFFTPSQGRGQLVNRPKTIRIRRELPGGKIIEAEASIIPSVEYGLPSTADQDKYLAFQQLVQERRRQSGGVLENPVPFSTYELCQRVGIAPSGRSYLEITEWLERMVSTTIRSRGTVYLAQRKTYVKDTFHVFDRVVAAGQEQEDGTVAEQNYVWLSGWQIENLNAGYQIPLDFESYRKLRTHIAKALVPLLQIWLYPTRAQGRFEKRYGDVCELLSLRVQKSPSLVQRQLGPALDELTTHGYLSNWSVAKMADGDDFKISLYHGPKFHSDLRLVARATGELEAGMVTEVSPDLMEALVRRGITERQARKLLEGIPADQPVLEQLEWADGIIQSGRIENPAGFIHAVIRNNERVPETFESEARREAQVQLASRDVADHGQKMAEERLYDEYIQQSVAVAVGELYAPEEYEAAIRRLEPEVRKQYPNIPPSTVNDLCKARLRAEIRSSLPLMTLGEFLSQRQFSLF